MVQSSKPDLVAVAHDTKGRSDRKRSVAVKIESPEEVSRHPEQVLENTVKSSTDYFHEVQVWAPEKGIGVATKMRDSLSDPANRAKLTMHSFRQGELDHYLLLFEGRVPSERKISQEWTTEPDTETHTQREPENAVDSEVVPTVRMREERLMLRLYPFVGEIPGGNRQVQKWCFRERSKPQWVRNSIEREPGDFWPQTRRAPTTPERRYRPDG